MKSFNTNTENEETYLTPPNIIKSLGEFDLDPCSPFNRPWDTAKNHYTKDDDGLLMPWFGRVWCNPPYGDKMKYFINKMALHNDGIALVFNRSETVAFQDYVFPFATSILYIRGRLKFYDIMGNQCKSNANAPSILISYGDDNADAIEESGIRGHHQLIKNNIVFISISHDKTWRIIVGEALEDLDKKAKLADIYDTVIKLAPKRVGKNKHYKAKIRQTLQMHFNRIDKGTYTC